MSVYSTNIVSNRNSKDTLLSIGEMSCQCFLSDQSSWIKNHKNGARVSETHNITKDKFLSDSFSWFNDSWIKNHKCIRSKGFGDTQLWIDAVQFSSIDTFSNLATLDNLQSWLGEGVWICLLKNLFAVTLTSALWIHSAVADTQHDVTFTLTMWLISHWAASNEPFSEVWNLSELSYFWNVAFMDTVCHSVLVKCMRDHEFKALCTLIGQQNYMLCTTNSLFAWYAQQMFSKDTKCNLALNLKLKVSNDSI